MIHFDRGSAKGLVMDEIDSDEREGEEEWRRCGALCAYEEHFESYLWLGTYAYEPLGNTRIVINSTIMIIANVYDKVVSHPFTR
jgi:hypothetical protein